MNIIDPLDERLISLLAQDARQSSTSLGKKIGASPATVRRRLGHLISSGMLSIVAVVDPAAMGLQVAAMIGMEVDRDKVRGVMETLAHLREVRWVSMTTGRFDVIAVVRCHSTEELSNFLQKQLSRSQGVTRSETFVCLRTVSNTAHARLEDTVL